MFPNGFEARMKRLLGDEYEDFLASYDRPRNVGLRLNPLKTEHLPDLPFTGAPVPWAKNGFYYDPAQRPGLHPWHEAGLYYLQEPSAMAPAGLLSPQPGERVLDLCAAPGGKTTQLAALMQNEGLLVCNEINPKRAQILSRNVERMGISCAVVLNEHPAKLAERFEGYFDKILVDAPCSGEGMFRKEEAAVTDWSEETVSMCANRQREILHSAAQMLKPGGRLVYSTCTFSPEENEGSIAALLAAHPEFEVEAVDCPYFSPGRPEWIEGGTPALSHTFRLWPHRLAGEGHFAAVLRKKDGTSAEQPPEPAVKLPEEWKTFAASCRIELPQGTPVLFGETLYLAPAETPRLRGLKVLRPGLELGQVRKGRFEPAHALALWLKTCPQLLDLDVQSNDLAKYLRGETVACTAEGWTLVCAGGLSVGWGKASNGILKNHYPKGLRKL